MTTATSLPFDTGLRDLVACEALGLALQRYGDETGAKINAYGIADKLLKLTGAPFADEDRRVVLGGMVAEAVDALRAGGN